MSEEAWFIGSRRRYPTTPQLGRTTSRVERLDPAEFREPDPGCDPARLRDYEIEVLERVIARWRDEG